MPIDRLVLVRGSVYGSFTQGFLLTGGAVSGVVALYAIDYIIETTRSKLTRHICDQHESGPKRPMVCGVKRTRDLDVALPLDSACRPEQDTHEDGLINSSNSLVDPRHMRKARERGCGDCIGTDYVWFKLAIYQQSEHEHEHAKTRHSSGYSTNLMFGFGGARTFKFIDVYFACRSIASRPRTSKCNLQKNTTMMRMRMRMKFDSSIRNYCTLYLGPLIHQ